MSLPRPGLADRHTHRAPSDCPVCGDHLVVTRLGCGSCGSELSGVFGSCPICALGEAGFRAYWRAPPPKRRLNPARTTLAVSSISTKAVGRNANCGVSLIRSVPKS